jgi:hypothetical protein
VKIAERGVLLPLAAKSLLEERGFFEDVWTFILRVGYLAGRYGDDRALATGQLAAAILWGGPIFAGGVGLIRGEANTVNDLLGQRGLLRLFEHVAAKPAVALANSDVGLLLAREASPPKHVVRSGLYLRKQTAASEALRGYVMERPEEVTRLSGLALTNIGVALDPTDRPGKPNAVLLAAHGRVIDADPTFRRQHCGDLMQYYACQRASPEGAVRFVRQQLKHFDVRDGRYARMQAYGATLLVDALDLCNENKAALGAERDQVLALLEEYHQSVGELAIVRDRFFQTSR